MSDPALPSKTPSGYGSAPSGRTPPLPPPRVPDHELIRRIGRGAYGEVWLARSVTGAYRAVKIVHRASFDHDRPFVREFEGILKFEPVSRTHDSQVDILHVGRGDDCFYYVMELADDQATGGQINPDNYAPRTLKSDLMFRGRLPFEECVRIGLALATALENLHGHGLVHRDVKPSNIIFVNGVAKLADIGLVTGVDATRSHVGTEGFAAPEGPGSPQADLYSLGKVLYEMATGKDRQEFPDLPTRLRELPDREGLMELNAVIARACRHDPKDRYASAAAMRADLELLQSGKSLSRLQRTEKRLRLVQRAGAMATAMALLIAAGWLWQARQTRIVRGLANEKSRLAESNANLTAQARDSELAAREQLYAADINLAHQALLADNLRQARALLQNHFPEPGRPDLRGFEWRYLWEQSRSEELFSLRGHTNGGRGIAFRPDGRWLATGGEGGTVKIWELASRREVASLNVTGEVRSVSFSPKGDLLAVVTTNSASVWDVHALTPLRRLPDAGWFSPEGRYFLACSQTPLPTSGNLLTSKLVLWDATSWRVISTLELPESWRHPEMREAGSWAALSPDGTRVAVILADAIRLFSIPDLRETGVLAQIFNAGASSTPFVKFSPDNNTLATLDSTGFGVQLWDIASQREVRILPAHSDRVLAVSFSPDGSRLATCSADQTIKLWAVATGELVRSFKADEFIDVAYSPDGKLLASVEAHDGSIKLWDANAKPRREFFRHPFGPVGFNLDSGLVAFGENLKPVAVDPETLQVTNTGLLNVTNSRAVVVRLDVINSKPGASEERWYVPYLGNLSQDGRTVGLFDLWEQSMDFWDVRDGKLLCSVEATKPWVAFAPKRQLVATDTTNATTTVWQLPSGTLKWVFTNRVGVFQAIAFSPDENFIVTDEGTRMKLWRIEREDVKPLLTFNPKRSPVIGLAFSPDGSLLATGVEGGPIKLWAMPSAEQVGVLRGHTANVISLAFSPDGRTLASMCDDRTVRLWHVATRRELLRFQAPKVDHYYFSLTFSPGGRALAARRVDDEGPITWVWHAPSLAEIAQDGRMQ